MTAVLRRVCGLLPILIGLACLFWPAAGVWKLQLVDYGAKYQKRVAYANKTAAKRAQKNGTPLVVRQPGGQGLSEFVKRETRRSLKQVQGPQWEELYERTAQQKNRPLLLPWETTPLSGLSRPDGGDYFSLLLPHRYPVFLGAVTVSPFGPGAGPEVTWGLAHPHAWLFPWLAGAGLLLYLALPRPRRRESIFQYQRFRSQIGPDLLGLILGAVFGILPLLIVSETSSRPEPLGGAGGWWVLTLALWFIAFISMALWAVATWHEKLRFRITPDGIHKENLFGVSHFYFDQMVGMRTTLWRPPAWFRSLSRLMVVFSLGMAMPMILGSMETAPLVEVRMKDGRTLSIMTKHLVGWQEMQKALLDRGVVYASQDQEELPDP